MRRFCWEDQIVLPCSICILGLGHNERIRPHLTLFILLLLNLLESFLTTNILLEFRSRQLKRLSNSCISDSSQSADGLQNTRVNQVLLLVQRILANPESRALENSHGARLVAWSCLAVEFLEHVELALDADNSLAHTSTLDSLAVV